MTKQDNKNKGRVTLRDAYDFLYLFFLGRPLYKFCSALLTAGVALISAPNFWEMVLSAILQIQLSQPNDNSGFRAQVIGLVLVISAVVLFCFFHFRDAKEKKKKERLARETDIRNNISGLIGFLETLTKGFSKPKIAKPAGYMSDEILKAKKLAQTVFDIGPFELRQNNLLNVLKDTGIDASGRAPAHNMSTKDIKELIAVLKPHV